MRRCPNPGCPFRVRHGFAAEFEDQVERCRSCAGPLAVPEPEPAGQAKFTGPLLARVGVSLVLLLGLIGFASAPVPGLRSLQAAGVDASFATLALWPSLLCWVAGTLVIGLLPAARTRRSTLPFWAPTLACTLALLAAASWAVHHSLDILEQLVTPSFPTLLLAMFAGLPVVLGVSLANDRWGLGHGFSLTLAGLLVRSLLADPALRADPLRAAIVVLTLIAGAAVWLAIPTRSSASGRRGGEADQGLGLGLTVPSCGLLPVFVLALGPYLRASVESGPTRIPLIALGLAEPPAVSKSPAPELAVLFLLALALAWLFTRPALLLGSWRLAFPKADPEALAAEASALFRRTLLRSALLLAVVQLLDREHLPAAAATILAAVTLDIIDELKIRSEHPALETIEAPSELVAAESLARALLLERRTAFVQGIHHRALYHRLGLCIPPRLLVAPKDRLRAQQLADAQT